MKLLSLSLPILAERIQTAHATKPRRLRLAFFAVLTVVVVLLSVKYAVKINKPGDSGQQSRSAFLRWRELINGVFRGENIYVGVNEYPNPPIMAILLRPFAALPPVAGALAWFYAKVLLAVLAALWVFRLVGRKPNPPTPFPGKEGGEPLLPSPPSAAPKAAGGGARVATCFAAGWCLSLR